MPNYSFRKKHFEVAFETLKTKGSDGMSDFIPVHFLRKVLTNFGEVMTVDEVDELIDDMDTDKDGRISYEEFVNSFEQD